MKQQSVKNLIHVLAAILLSLLFGTLLAFVFGRDSEQRIRNEIQTAMNGYEETLNAIYENDLSIFGEFKRYNENTMGIITTMLKNKVDGDNYTGRRIFEDGIVVRYHNGTVELPESEEVMDLTISAEELEKGGISDEPHTFIKKDGSKEDCYISTGKIDGEYYYVDFEPYYELDQIYTSRSNFKLIMEAIETSADCYIANVTLNGESVYSCEFLREMGIDTSGTSENFTSSGRITVKDAAYFPVYAELPDSGWQFYIYASTADILFEGDNWRFLFCMITLLFTLTMITYNLAIKKFVGDYALSEEQKKRYEPGKVTLNNAISTVITVIIVFAVGLLISALMTVRRDVNRGRSVLENLYSGIDQDLNLDSSYYKEKESWYTYYADKIAELSEEYDNAPDKAALEQVNRILDAYYIMLYDDSGNQIISSNNYRNFTLGTSSSSDFRRILNGVSPIICDAGVDEYTGLDSKQIGVKMNMTKTGNYGAMILTLDSKTLVSDADRYISNRINTVTVSEDLLLITDQETGDILFDSAEEYSVMNISDLGLDTTKLTSSGMSVCTLKGKTYILQSKKNSDSSLISYYFSGNTFSSASAFRLPLIFTVCFLAVYLSCMFLACRGYNREFFEENASQGEETSSDDLISNAAEGINKNPGENSENRHTIPLFWNYMLPEQKAKTVFFCFLALEITLVLFGLLKGSELNDTLLISYLLNGEWEKQINLFSLFSVFIIIVINLVLLAFIRYILMLISLPLDSRGQTICRLLFNLTKYIAIISVLYYSFGSLGFDTRSILASLGIVSLAISLGSKDLVNDIVAGVMMIFENDFQVGDIVEISGNRGLVQEIGVRSTKLFVKGNNIKYINNRDVKNVLNLTRLNSCITTELTIPSSQSLDDVISMLEEELPKIGAKESRIKEGPTYYGVTKFNGNSSTIAIVTECRESDYYVVESYLNKALIDLFREKDIKLM